jgi:protein gp37
MSATNIEWTDFTWNPVRGCSRKSKGCINCYAEHQAARIVRMDRGRGIPEGQGAYDGLVEMTSQGPKWTGKISEVWGALDTPLRMKTPRRIFVNSMSDLFHANVSDAFIAEVLAHAAYARQHTFQILTKCPERMQSLLTSEAFMELYEDACSSVCVEAEEILARRGEFSVHARLTTDIRAMNPAWPRPNIHMGVSTEDQETANARIPLLLATPAAIRFVSAEPLLSAIDFTRIQNAGPLHAKYAFIDALRAAPGAKFQPRASVCALRTVRWKSSIGSSPAARAARRLGHRIPTGIAVCATNAQLQACHFCSSNGVSSSPEAPTPRILRLLTSQRASCTGAMARSGADRMASAPASSW